MEKWGKTLGRDIFFRGWNLILDNLDALAHNNHGTHRGRLLFDLSH